MRALTHHAPHAGAPVRGAGSEAQLDGALLAKLVLDGKRPRETHAFGAAIHVAGMQGRGARHFDDVAVDAVDRRHVSVALHRIQHPPWKPSQRRVVVHELRPLQTPHHTHATAYRTCSVNCARHPRVRASRFLVLVPLSFFYEAVVQHAEVIYFALPWLTVA